jgi:hypothetical protein
MWHEPVTSRAAPANSISIDSWLAGNGESLVDLGNFNSD